MTRTVDCRDCIYFTPRWKFTDNEWEALKLTARENPGREKPPTGEYGYCSKLNMIVVYLRGHCRHHQPKPRPLGIPGADPHQESILNYLSDRGG